MSKNTYFLIARNKDNNELKIIPISNKKGNSLEAIDLFTTNYQDEQELIQDLIRKKLISASNIDLFIVNQKKRDNQVTIKTQELLYQKNRTIKSIAEASLDGKIEEKSKEIDAILDEFAIEMKNNKTFWERVVSGKTNVFQKYSKYFIYSQENIFGMKYKDGGWARKSYSLIRNILEAQSRKKIDHTRIDNEVYRMLAKKELVRITSKTYDENQISMFDTFKTEESQLDEKRLEVMNTFENLPKNTFVIENEKARFNINCFSNYTDYDLEILQKKLPERLQYTLQLLAIHKETYEMDSPFSNDCFQLPIILGQKKILELLEDKNVLEDAYLWCQLYEKYKEKEMKKNNGIQYRKENKKS